MTDRRFINHHSLNQEGKLIDIECRFCRHRQKFNKWTYVAPCGCYGPTRYVHRQCLQKWIILKFQHVYNNNSQGDPEEFNVFCEKCKQRMEIQFVLTHKLTKYNQLVQKLSSKKILLVVLLTLITISLVGMIIFSILSHRKKDDIPLGIIVGLSLSIVLFCTIIGVFVAKFLFIKSIYITYMANHKQQPKLMIINERNIDSVERQDNINQNAHFGQNKEVKYHYDKSLMLQSKLKNDRNSKFSDKQSVASKTLTDYVMKKMYTHDDDVSQKGDLASKNNLPLPFGRKNNYERKSLQKQKGLDKDYEINFDKIPRQRKAVHFQSVSNKNQAFKINVKPINLQNENIQDNTIIHSKPFKNGKQFSFQNRLQSTKRKKIFSQTVIPAKKLDFQSSPNLKYDHQSIKQIQAPKMIKQDEAEKIQSNPDIFKQQDSQKEPGQTYCKDPIFIKDKLPNLKTHSRPTSIIDPLQSQYTSKEDNASDLTNKLQLKNKNDPIKIKLLF